MDRRNFKLEIKELDEEQGTFVGYAAVFGNEDLAGDVIEPGAFKKTLQENARIPILWQHDAREPIGVTLEAAEDKRGLLVKGKLVLESVRGREAYALLKAGAIKGLSIGFDTVKWAMDKTIRRLQEIRLWEWSLVTFPANPLAEVTAVKADEQKTPEEQPTSSPGEEKAGRVLSARNLGLVRQAVEALQALLDAAEPADDEEDDEDSKALPRSEPAQSTQPTEPPADNGRPDLIHLLADMRTYVKQRSVN